MRVRAAPRVDVNAAPHTHRTRHAYGELGARVMGLGLGCYCRARVRLRGLGLGLGLGSGLGLGLGVGLGFGARRAVVGERVHEGAGGGDARGLAGKAWG